MAATPLPWTAIDRNANVVPAAEVTGDTVNGHSAQNDGYVEIIVRNADGAAAHNVTFNYSPAVTADGTAIPGRIVSVPLASSKKFYGFPQSLYGSVLSITVDSAQLKLSAEHKIGANN